MTPTIGRIVHYHPTDEERELWAGDEIGNPIDPGEPLAAVVVAVWTETTVNLRVLTDGNLTPWVTSACLGDEPGEWNWPPRA